MPSALPVEDRVATAPALAAIRLRLDSFRSYRRLDLEVGPGPIVLHGDNGAGKTNLLEALSLLAPGRGLRQAVTTELDRNGVEPWTAAAIVVTRDGPCEVRTGHDRTGDRRYVELDGRRLRGTAGLAGLGGILWLIPAQDRLFQDGPAGRRRFLDRLVLLIDPDHAGRVQHYERTVRERSILLRQGRADPAWLVVLESRLASLGVSVVAARRELVMALGKLLAREASPFPTPRLAVTGEVEAWLEAMPAAEVEDRVVGALAAARATDAHAGGAAVGPHRGDLLVFDAASGECARDCSTGQQKALLVRLVLTATGLAAELAGIRPMLLLDEIEAHLDRRRRAELADVVTGLGAQAWLTGTDRSFFSALEGRARFLHVNSSEVRHDG